MGRKKRKVISTKWQRRKRTQEALKKEMNNEKKQEADTEEGQQSGSRLDGNESQEADQVNKTGASSQRKKSRRQSGEIIWDSDHFPACSKFQPPTKLPTIKSVVGRVRFLTMGGKHQMQRNTAVKQVALEIECKYYHDTCTA